MAETKGLIKEVDTRLHDPQGGRIPHAPPPVNPAMRAHFERLIDEIIYSVMGARWYTGHFQVYLPHGRWSFPIQAPKHASAR